MPSTTSTQTRRSTEEGPPAASGANRESALVLVKAVPRPSKTYQETVCCAGVTASGEWRRLYPVRFRQLAQGQQFARWQWVGYAWRQARGDGRRESRRIEEDTIEAGLRQPERDRLPLLLPLLRGSTREAAERGESLALIEPRELRLRARAKKQDFIEAERHAYRDAARQGSLLDNTLAELEPCPYAVQIGFSDQDGVRHAPQCQDWETTAAFFNLRRHKPDAEIVAHLEREYTEPRPGRRVLLAMGNVARRPRQWLLLAVLRVPEVRERGSGQLLLGL